jgi:hypothetical protein
MLRSVTTMFGDGFEGLLEGLQAVVRLGYPESGLCQPIGVQPSAVPVVLDEQHVEPGHLLSCHGSVYVDCSASV